ncbi:MAG: hypothetical protein KF829_06705 [Ferruginibacter sp.]|nr:hypothetical protein [Ferruginibacter sp.]
MKTKSFSVINIIKRSVFLLCLIMSALLSKSQIAPPITVSFVLQPPYSSNYSSYENLSNRIIINLVGGARAQDIVLHGKLSNFDRDFSIATKQNYIGGVFNLGIAQPKTIINDPTQLRFLARNNIDRLSSSDADWTRLMSENQLPEGQYELCINAFAVVGGQVSNMAGSACFTFFITNAQPPVITSPVNGQELDPLLPNTVFTWTPPIGNTLGANIVYDLYVVKVAEGQNPNEAINGAVTYKAGNPIIIKNLTTNQYVTQPYDLKIAPNVLYAVQVVARDVNKNVGFANNGRSEVVTFSKGEVGGGVVAGNDDFTFDILNPSPVPDTFKISSSRKFHVNWGWKFENKTFELTKIPAFAEKNIKNYRFYLLPGKTKSGHKTDANFQFQKNIAADDTYSFNLFEEDDEGLQAIKMKPDYWYRMKIEAIDAKGNTVNTIESKDFNLVFEAQTDERVVNISGTLKYFFDGYTGLHYPIANSQVKFYKADEPENSTTGFFDKTDEDGNFTVSVPASEIVSPSTAYKMKIISPYYRQIDTAIVKLSPDSFFGDAATVRLGEVATPVYSYSLDLRLEKRYRKEYKFEEKYYELKNTGESIEKVEKTRTVIIQPDADAIKEIPAGIPVQLYRKQKSADIPPSEGDLLNNKSRNLILIAEGKTAIRAGENGEKEAYVKFNRLVCNLGDNKDMYYLRAVNPDNKGQSFQDGEFEAPEQELVFSKPSADNPTHFEIDTTYNIYSKEPPKSLISGQLVYQWPGDPQKTLRPLSNRKFSIQAIYLLNGKPIWPCIYALTPNSIYVDDKLVSGGGPVTVGTGQTDAKGNFSIEAYNLNAKGVIENAEWYGVLMGDKGCKPPPPPSQKTTGIPNIQDMVTQPALSSITLSSLTQGLNFSQLDGMFGAQSQTGGLFGTMNYGNAVFGGKNTQSLQGNQLMQQSAPRHGPNADFVEEQAPSAQKIERVFRIVLNDAEYFYSPDKNIVVQPTENINIGSVVAMVKEVKWKIKVVDQNNNTLSGMKTVVFREPNARSSNLPVTEGDGAYRKQKLINPQFEGDVTIPQNDKTNAQSNQKPSGGGVGVVGQWQANLNYNFGNVVTSMLNTNQYEWLTDSVTGNDGSVTFDRVLGRFDYYLEVASNPVIGGDFYQANIDQLWNVPPDEWKKRNQFNPIFWDEQTIKIPEIEKTVTMKPEPSRIFGRVQDDASRDGLANVPVLIYIQNKAKNINVYKSVSTDSYGYFQLLNVFDGLDDKIMNVDFYLIAIKKGYRQKGGESYGTLSRTGKQAGTTILMIPDAEITGRVIDEKGKPIHAYIKRDDGLVIETGFILNITGRAPEESGKFSLPIPSGQTAKIYIIPEDPGYFNDTLTVTVKKGINNQGDIIAYRRTHRMRFFVKDNETGADIGNVKVSLSDELYDNTKPAIMSAVARPAEFNFENISVNNYTATIVAPAELGFTPMVVNLKNEESKDFNNYTVRLKKGGVVSGKVTLDGNPVAGARVYLQYEKAGSSYSLGNLQAQIITSTTIPGPTSVGSGATPVGSEVGEVETRSDAYGNYSLAGLPVKTGSVQIVATLDTNFTVSGDKKLVSFTAGKATADLNLKKFGDMEIKTVFGFPLQIEKIETTSDKNKVTVTGIVNLSAGHSDFKYIPATRKDIRISNITFTAKEVNGKKTAQPDVNQVPLDATSSLTLGYKDFNVRVAASNKNKTTLLSIRKENEEGLLSGFVNIIDNSFNYPSTYLNFTNKEGFYLAAAKGETYTNQLTVFRASTGGNSESVFHLTDESGKPILFKFIGFDATADIAGSYIAQDGKIHLKADLDCYIPHANPEKFKVQIPEVVLDKDEVHPAASGTPLTLKLEEWTLQVKDWKIDPVKGGIYSSNGLVKTGKLDVPFTKFNLRADMVVIDNFTVSEISLGGGVKKVEGISDKTAKLTYDSKAGSDMMGHWKLSVTGENGGPAGVIRNLSPNGVANHPKPFLNGDIKLGYVELLSNGEDILTILNGSTPMLINKNRLAQFTPQMIASGPDFFTILGALNIPAPKLVPTMTLLQFSGKPQTLKMDIKDLLMSFEGQGYVNFISDTKHKPIITNDLIQIEGYVIEEGALNPISSTFYADSKGADYYHVDLEKGFKLNLTDEVTPDKRGQVEGRYNLKIIEGKMEVPLGGNDWGLLSFKGNHYSNSDKTLKASSNNVMTFTVDGDISVSGSGIDVTNISTPLGNMSLIYDFAEKRLIGKVQVSKQKIGPVEGDGNIQILFDPQGWYILGAVNVNLPIPVPLNNWNMALILGNRTFSGSGPSWQNDIVPVLTQYSHDRSKICWLKGRNSIKGFFVTAGKDLINVDLDYGFDPVAGLSILARVSVEASFFTSLSDNDNWLLRATAGVSGVVRVSASAAGVSASGQVGVDAGISGAVSADNIEVGGDFSVTVTGEVSVPLVYDGSFSVAAKAHATISTKNGIDASFSLGSGGEKGCN